MPLVRIDHASLTVPDLGQAAARFEALLGLAARATPSAPHHARLHLHHSYLELRQQGDGWHLPIFFFRFEDAAGTKTALTARGMAVDGPSLYQGLDGIWSELHPQSPPDVPPAPLVRRISPPELALDWPPAGGESPSLGRLALSGVVVECSAFEAAGEHFGQLLGSVRADANNFEASGKSFRRLEAGGGEAGRIIVLEGGGNLRGTLLSCPSLKRVRTKLSELKLWCSEDERRPGELWLDPAAMGGLLFGFVER